MLWACLHFPDLPLRAVFDTQELRQPCAIVAGPRQRPLVVDANAGARKAGVQRRHVLAAARALCAGLQARARDAGAEQRLLHSLAAWAYRFSSHVSLSEPDALLIEVGASLRLFGGWDALQRQLRAELADLEFHPAIAVAPLPAAARVLARRRDGFFAAQPAAMLEALADVPLAQAGLPEDTITLLHRVGFARLRDVFALPRPELARRTGPGVLLALDRLRGLETDLLPLYRPPDAFAHRVELDDRVEAWPPLLFPLRRLCGELALFLAARDGGVQRCELALDHENRQVTRVPIELLAPQREARRLYELIRSRLERVALEQPVCGIALIAKDLPTFKPQHRDLFEPKRAQALDWPELAERLRAHLGDDTVRGLAQAADHRPEKAWRFAHDAQLIAAEVRRRPLWLLPQAIPLRGPAPRILAGPERIESGWWDGGDTRRDYYVVRTREGQRAWAYLPAGEHNGWMLHGWFA